MVDFLPLPLPLFLQILLLVYFFFMYPIEALVELFVCADPLKE